MSEQQQPRGRYGDEFSDIVETEDDEGGGAPAPAARPSVMASLFSRFGWGKSPGPGSAEPVRGNSVDEKIRRDLNVPTDRRKLYAIYSDMMTHPVTSGIVEAFAEEATPEDQERGRVCWPHATGDGAAKVERAVETCLTAIQAEASAYPIVESFLSCGDHYERLMTRPEAGVIGMSRLLPGEVDRVEDVHRRIVGFRVQGAEFPGRAGDKSLSYPWDVVHWRMSPRYDPKATAGDRYGRAMLFAMVRPWRQLVLCEDRVLKQRLKRGGRYYWKIPVPAGSTEAEALRTARAARKALSQDEVAGGDSYVKRANPVGDLEDVYWPVRAGDEAPEAQDLPDVSGDVVLSDVEYFTDLIYGVSKINRGYFGRSDTVQFDRTKTISQQDLRVARIARRVRAIYLRGLKTACDVHLAIVAPGLSLDADKAIQSYTLRTPRLGALEELDRIEVVKMQIDVAEALANLGTGLRLNPSLWTAYLLVTYLKMPADMAITLLAKAGEVATNNGGGHGGVDVPPAPGDDGSGGGFPGESQLARGLYPLNEAEQTVLKKLGSDPRVQNAMTRVGELTGCHYLPEDVAYQLPALNEADLDEYLKYDDEAIKAAVRENYARTRSK